MPANDDGVPETQFVRADDGATLAYQLHGSGAEDVMVIMTMHCVDLMWEHAVMAHASRRLARFARVVAMDYRGFGAADNVPLGELPTAEGWMEDTRVVLDAVGSESVNLVVHGGSGFLGLLFAATYPERTKTLTLINASACIVEREGYPIGLPDGLVGRYVENDRGSWGTVDHARMWAPSRADDEPFLRWLARYERASSSPGTHTAILQWLLRLDVRAVLPSVRVPTLLLHRERPTILPMAHAEYMAAHIPNATLGVLPGQDYWPFAERTDDVILDRIEEFVTGVAPGAEPDRALATILFTDIVASTETAARLGDRAWKSLLDDHDAIVDHELLRHRGRKVNPTGDGMVATFDGPARAVRCASAIRQGVASLGVAVRAGLHVGEVELRGDDIGGIAVHIAQRVSSLAGPDEVLVSRTVTDLVAGSGLVFEDRGEHDLKGVPGTWQLFALSAG